jgi:DNA-binding LytR/AlgR family response regulator
VGSHFDAPGCILLDLLNGRTPGLNDLELQQALATADRQLPIVFVTGHGDILMSVQAMLFATEKETILLAIILKVCQRISGAGFRTNKYLHPLATAPAAKTEPYLHED